MVEFVLVELMHGIFPRATTTTDSNQDDLQQFQGQETFSGLH